MARNEPFNDVRDEQGHLFETENGQKVLYHSNGDRTYFLDTDISATGGRILITFPSADAVTGSLFFCKVISGVTNVAQVTALSGNFDGTATATIGWQYTSAIWRSDGINYYRFA